MYKKIIFFIDFNDKSGLGHLKRCLKLSKYFPKSDVTFLLQKKIKFKNITCKVFSLNEFIKNNSNKYDLAIIDSYNNKVEEQKKISKFCKKILVIDDLCNKKFYCDYLINYNPLIKKSDYSTKLLKKTKLFLGLQYNFLINFIESKKRSKNDKINIFIYFGTKDRTELIKKTIQTLNNIKNKINKVIIFSNFNFNISHKDFKIKIFKISEKKNIINFMKNCDILIISTGVILYEALALNKIIFGTPISINQIPHFNYFEKKKYIFDLNQLDMQFNDKINFKKKKYLNFINDDNDIIIKNITNPIFDKNNNRIYIENFNSKYLINLFSMQSSEFRKYYKNTNKFTYQKHVQYFKKIINNKNIKFLIIKLEDVFCGYVKTEKIDKKTIISIGLREQFQRIGIGSEILKFLRINNFFKNTPTAQINKNNTASLNAFKNANIKNIEKF